MSLIQRDVLLVDDDPDLRRMVRKVLEAAGVNVFEAATVKDAIAHVQHRMPHLVVLDLNMPEESGFDFLEARRTLAGFGQVPVIVLSGLRDRASVFKAMSLGATDYVAKPLNAALLLQKFRKFFLSDKGTARVVFADSQRPKLKALVPVNITAANENGLVVQMPAKFLGQADITVRSQLLSMLGASRALIRPAARASVGIPQQPGLYQSELCFIGLDDATIKNIRQIIKEWK